jgi:hypothetical protein
MWVKIDDSKVRSLWVCDDCGQRAHCNPHEYADIGTPVCTECDVDLSYVETEVYKEDK